MSSRRRHILLGLLVLSSFILAACADGQDVSAPGLTFSLDARGEEPQQVGSGVQLLLLLTVLSLAPAVLILATAFTRIVIVLSLVRSALGTQQIPPNQIIVGLALLLTFFVMAPVWEDVNARAVEPFLDGEINQKTAFERGSEPLRQFMFKQTRTKDIALFVQLSGHPQPNALEDIPSSVLLPAFVISELKTAFQMGFVIFVAV